MGAFGLNVVPDAGECDNALGRIRQHLDLVNSRLCFDARGGDGKIPCR